MLINSISKSISRNISRNISHRVNYTKNILTTVTDNSIPFRDMLNVSFGESNSGGYALNSDAASWEIGSRSELQIWNVNTNVFQNLDIGTNNNLDHAGLNSTTHGWELGLANRIKQGQLGSNDWYYVQTGQGGSKISDWVEGGAYWTKFISRTTAAKAAMPNEYNIAVWMTLGINDALAGTPLSASAYRSGLEEIITRIKVQLPNCKIFILTLPPVNATYTGYSQQIELIADADDDVYSISATSPATLDMRDTNHWSYRGMKRVAARFVQKIQDVYNLAPKWLVWNQRGDAGYTYFSAVNQHAAVSAIIDFSVDDQFIAVDYAAATTGIVFAIDDDITEVNWGGVDAYNGGAFMSGGTLFRATGNNTGTSTGQSTPLWARFRKSGNNLLLDTSTDGGTTWTNRHTFTGALTGKSTVRVKALTAIGAGEIDSWSSESQNTAGIILTQPQNTVGIVGYTATFSIDAIFASTYQWQKQESGIGAWSNISGATSNTYTTGVLSIASDNGDKYRCVLEGSVVSSEATLSVVAFSPSNIPSCLAFFDAGSNVYQEHNATTTPTTNGNVVGTWVSTVGSRKLTAAASDTTRPTLVTNVVNGLPVIRFDGSNDKLVADAAMNAKTIFIVVKYRSATVVTSFAGIFTSNANASVNISMVLEAAGGTKLVDLLVGSGNLVRRNGVATTINTAAPNDVDGPMNAFTKYILSSSTASNFTWQLAADRQDTGRPGLIDVACLGIYQDQLSTEIMLSLEQWAQDTYGI